MSAIESGSRPAPSSGFIAATVDRVEYRHTFDQASTPDYLEDDSRYAGESVEDRAIAEAADAERLKEWRDDTWHFIGIRAVAIIRFYLPSHPDGSCGSVEVASPGLWGIESDSGETYLHTVEVEEKESLCDMLAALNLTIPVGTIEVRP